MSKSQSRWCRFQDCDFYSDWLRRTSFLLTASMDGHLKFWRKKDPNDDEGDSASGVGIE